MVRYIVLLGINRSHLVPGVFFSSLREETVLIYRYILVAGRAFRTSLLGRRVFHENDTSFAPSEVFTSPFFGRSRAFNSPSSSL